MVVDWRRVLLVRFPWAAAAIVYECDDSGIVVVEMREDVWVSTSTVSRGSRGAA